jgi:NitT/TauT family transport system substrate-binding protein
MPRGVTGRGLRTRLPMAATAIMLVTTLTSCGLLGSEDESNAAASGGNGDLEKTKIKVATQLTSDVAPFHLALKEGFFKDEGLDVEYVDVPNSGLAIEKLLGGETVMSYGTYTPFIAVESQKGAQNQGGMKIIADASSAGPGSTMIVALPDSKVKSVKDMAGAKVAIPATGTIADLLTSSVVKANGIDPKKINWIQTTFPDMPAALKSKRVDAAFVTEPFITLTQKVAGAQPVFDTAVGATADMPTAGWATTGDFVQENPKTVAAFQRAMQKATDLALEDRSLIEPILVEYTKVDEDTAKMATLLTFQSKLDAKRIQRVSDMMLEFKAIPKPIDVSGMVVPSAPVS